MAADGNFPLWGFDWGANLLGAIRDARREVGKIGQRRRAFHRGRARRQTEEHPDQRRCPAGANPRAPGGIDKWAAARRDGIAPGRRRHRRAEGAPRLAARQPLTQRGDRSPQIARAPAAIPGSILLCAFGSLDSVAPTRRRRQSEATEERFRTDAIAREWLGWCTPVGQSAIWPGRRFVFQCSRVLQSGSPARHPFTCRQHVTRCLARRTPCVGAGLGGTGLARGAPAIVNTVAPSSLSPLG